MSRRKVWESKNVEYRAEAIDRLREMFPAGSVVTTTVKHVSQSGMGRVIAVLGYDTAAGRIRNVSGDVARVLDWSLDDRGGVWVTGCGMDMAFHLTYTLSRALYRDGWEGEGSSRDAGYLLSQNTI